MSRVRTVDVDNYKSILADFLKKVNIDQCLTFTRDNIESPLYNQESGLDSLHVSLIPYAVSRLQRTLLYLLQKGLISLDDEEWNFTIIERDISFSVLAIDDFINLLRSFYALLEIDKDPPNIFLQIINTEEFHYIDSWEIENKNIIADYLGTINNSKIPLSDILIDFSILRRYGLESGDRFYNTAPNDIKLRVRSGYSLTPSRRVATANPIKYNLSTADKDQHLLFFLQNVFRKTDFREGQKQIIKNALARRNTIGLLPTGAGKSLCYQLVTLLQPAITLVIDPIKSLMMDQDRNLKLYGIDSTTYISSDLTPEERRILTKRFFRGEFQYIFITPERLQIKEFRGELRSLANKFPIGYGVVDEAHCVSEWGHDFRTSYLMLSKTIRENSKYNGEPPPIYALTGTASEIVLRDILVDLGITEEEEHTGSVIKPMTFNRPELKFYPYQVPSEDKYRKLKEIYDDICSQFRISKHELMSINGDGTYSGLIFCPHVNSTEYSIEKIKNRLGEEFGFRKIQQKTTIKDRIQCDKCGSDMIIRTRRSDGNKFYGCSSYPACKNTKPLGMNPEFYDRIHIFAGTSPKNVDEESWRNYKKQAQTEFIENKVPLLITTKSFGMGIDKPNIRYTIHYNLPPSIEAYYQEAGRAGRDGRDSYCAIIFSDDNNNDSAKRLDPKLFADEVWNMDKVQGQESDIHRNLYFQKRSFEGKVAEWKKIVTLLKGDIGNELATSDPKPTISIPPLKTQTRYGMTDDESGTEKAIYRLLILGIIDDYTIEFSKPRQYNLELRKKEHIEYAKSLYNYLKLRDSKFKYNSADEFYDYLKNSNSERHFVLNCLEKLIDFIYTQIEPQRREALRDMADAARSKTGGEFINKILRYLSPDEEFNFLFRIFPESQNENEWINIIKKAVDSSATNKLLGICQRTLESYPQHAGLRFMAASLRLSLHDETEELGLQDFKAGVRFSKDMFDSEKAEKIAKYFLDYILLNSKYPETNKQVSIHFISEFYSLENAKLLYYSNYDDEIRKIGTTLLLDHLSDKTLKLISKMRA